MSGLIRRAPRPGWHVTHLEEADQSGGWHDRMTKRLRVVTERVLPDGTLLKVEAFLSSEDEIPALGPLLDAAEAFSYPDFRAEVTRTKASHLVADRYRRRESQIRSLE